MNNEHEQSRPTFAESFPPTPHGIPVPWMRAAGILVLLSLILQHGFPIGIAAIEWLNWLDVLLALCFGADLVLALFKDRKWKRAFELRRFEYRIPNP